MKLGPFIRKRTNSLNETVRRFSGILDYSEWVLFDPSKFKTIKRENIKKILVVLVHGKERNVGTGFCILGVMRHFKKVYPEVEVSFLVDKNTKKLFGRVPKIEMIEYKEGIIDELKERKIDALLWLHPGILNIRDFLFVPHRIALSTISPRGLLNGKNKLFITRKVYIPLYMHMVRFYFKMLETLGFKFDRYDVSFYFDKKDENAVKKFLNENKIKKFIVIHPGGKYLVDTLKRGKCSPYFWSFERYGKVAEHFSKKGYSIVITGTKEEEFLYKEIKKKTKAKILNACGKFSVREAGALLNNASLLVSIDTSIVHIAYQLKIPIVELMGPQYPESVGAWPLDSKRHEILVDRGPCSRSMKKIECPEDVPCLDGIKTSDVISSAEKLLKKN